MKVPFEVTSFHESRIEGEPQAAIDDVIDQIADVDFAKVSASIGDLVAQMSENLKPRPGGPSLCEVQFALKVNAEGNIIISKVGGEVSITIKVVWDRNSDLPIVETKA